MIVVNVFFLIFILGRAVNANVATPTYQWVTCPLKTFDACMSVDFNNGQESDLILLKKYGQHHDSKAYLGHFLGQPNVTVSLSGGDPFSTDSPIFVSFKSDQLPLDANLFCIQNGTTIRIIHSSTSESESVQSAIIVSSDQMESHGREFLSSTRTMRETSQQPLPAHGFQLDIVFVLSKNFLTRFGTESDRVLDRVLVHAQNFFDNASTLKTTVYLNPVDVIHWPNRTDFEAIANDIGVFVKSASGLPTANIYAMLTTDINSQAKIISLRDSACKLKEKVTYPYSITEYFIDDLQTARKLTQSIAVNLGMTFTITREECRNTIMDLSTSTATAWSSCSVDEFTNYYNAIIGSQGNFCLVRRVSPASRQCKDYRREVKCQYWYMHGKCDRFYVRHVCRRTCKLC